MARIYRIIEAILAVVAGTGLLVMMVLTFVDVIGRYGFHKSIFGTAEYVELLMMVTIFAGVAFVSASNQHITVSIFQGWVDRHAPNLQRWVVLVFTLMVYALITYQFFNYGFSELRTGTLTPVLALPTWIIPVSAGVLSAFGVLLYASAIIHTRGRPEQLDAGVAKADPDSLGGFE
ncbi:TRAP transporter small permease subunit [bacterium]|nr:TRAP transporter small permease subunit [bacterium]